MDTSTTAIDTVIAVWKALEVGDRARLGELLAPDIVYTDSTAFLHKPEFHGRDETLGFMLGLHGAYPEMLLQITDIFSAGDRVVLQGFVTGTHARESIFHGVTIPATDRVLTLPICQVCTVRNGRIVKAASYYDAATLNAQLGRASEPAAVTHEEELPTPPRDPQPARKPPGYLAAELMTEPKRVYDWAYGPAPDKD